MLACHHAYLPRITTNPALAEESKVQPKRTTQQPTTANKVETKEDSFYWSKFNNFYNKSKETPAKKEEDKAQKSKKKVSIRGNYWRFYENNAPVLNWKNSRKWYYFNKDGIMLSDTIFLIYPD